MSNPWKEKEAQDRKDNFLKDYEKLIKKYDIVLMAFPEFVPSGQTGFNISATMSCFDKRQMNVPSPIQSEDLAK